MARLSASLLLAVVILCSMGARASAQEGTAPPPATSSRSHASNHAGGPIGVGGIAYLSGPVGLSVVFDAGIFHIDTLLALSGGNAAENGLFQLGGRFWYHVASSTAADLSLGAGALYQYVNFVGPGTNNNLFIEIGGLIRVFLAPNVALSTGAGIQLRTLDDDGYSVGNSNLTGNAAFHYFF